MTQLWKRGRFSGPRVCDFCSAEEEAASPSIQKSSEKSSNMSVKDRKVSALHGRTRHGQVCHAWCHVRLCGGYDNHHFVRHGQLGHSVFLILFETISVAPAAPSKLLTYWSKVCRIISAHVSHVRCYALSLLACATQYDSFGVLRRKKKSMLDRRAKSSC
ncbi:hypothetical protein EI94DRAFT_88024 [Lactarius quietus]|nr:hypothetical protein EI94DRAFT_88024 [Lactarius quietus]